ncbi:fungal specific transcription factor domain-containing [Trichoderma arundinaceum]|uniref:Fungal specific transcription factor domain-containing n=1 Tax=Trichoderma arundinaceum TaxID=490622 RepID=A0A395NDR6_TRIAR|nr:fungal specific transcription factor domain-containing [Trichoderma arundinaceum]
MAGRNFVVLPAPNPAWSVVGQPRVESRMSAPGERAIGDGHSPGKTLQSRIRDRAAAAEATAAVETPVSVESTPVTQSSFLGRSDYMTSNDLAIDEDDAMQYKAASTNATSITLELQSSVLSSARTIGLPPQSVKLSLVKSFLDRGKPWMPIVDESDLDPLLSQSTPSFLLSAVLVAGSKLSAAPNALEWGEKCYLYAKTLLFYGGSGHSVLQSIVATVLLQWWNPSGPEHVSLDSSSLWLRITVGLAHQLGLHREPDPALPDARLRRRLWWTMVTRDNQIATSHGRPRLLEPQDSNVKPLRFNDFDDPQDPDVPLFIFFVRINSILADIVCHYRRGSLSERNRMDIETALLQWISDLPPSLHLFERNSRNLNPYNFKTRQLYVPYFVAIIIINRSNSPAQQFSLASLMAASLVTRIFEEYMDWADIMFLAPTSIFYLLVAGLIQISSHRYPDMAQRADPEVRTVRNALNELKKRFPTAQGAERIYENILSFSGSIGTLDEPSMLEEFLTDRRNVMTIPRVAAASSDNDGTSSQALNNRLGQRRSSIQLSQPAIGEGEFSFGSLESWWPDWLDPNFT